MFRLTAKLRLALTALCRIEHQADLLWIPADSAYNLNQQWLDKNFKKNERLQIVTFQSENVLSPESINKVGLIVVMNDCSVLLFHQMFDLYQQVQAITVDGKKFQDICAR